MAKASREGTCEWETLAATFVTDDEKLKPAPCDNPIEARRVCRQHYHKLKKLMTAAGTVPEPRTSATKKATQAPKADSVEAEVIASLHNDDPDRKRIARVADYSVWLDYAPDPKDKRKKLMAEGTLWMGTAYVDMEAGDRYNDLTPEDINQRHTDRVTQFIADEAKRQKLKKSELLRDRKDLLWLLIYGKKGRECQASKRWAQISDALANDERARNGMDSHGRRNKALRSIDMAKAATKLGLGDSPDLGNKEVVIAVLDAIEDGRIKS